MSKLINAKIDVLKIDKSLLFKGAKGTYLDLTIWINDKPDQFGNDISIEQRTKKGDNKIYLGNGKFYVKKDSPENNEGKAQKGTDIESQIRNGDFVDNPDELPF
jgi:hypothetical protein